jgi:23S rRNA pseudouridine1911/1915/1917 synthase
MSLEIDVPDEEQEEQDLYEHIKIVAAKGQELIRIDKFLMTRVQNATRNKIQQGIEAGNVLVNGKPIKSNYRIKPFDTISIVFAHPPREIEIVPENIPINIVYEDENLVVVNKDPGMVVHPGFGNYKGTLVNALAYHFKNLPMKAGGEARPGLVHRIDKNTSGIILVAKDEISLARLAKDFFDRTIDRKYVALVWGDLNPKDRKLMYVFPSGEEGKHAVTHYKVLERFGYVTMIECKLETGRTHQIRVHMQYLGHPIFNDERYGGNKILKGTTFAKYKQFVENCFKLMPRHGLHAKSLGFTHPITGKKLFFDSELPSDMSDVVEKWRAYSKTMEK